MRRAESRIVKAFSEMTMAMKRLIWAALIGILLTPAVASAQAEEVVYFHTDAIGSVRMITDSSGTVLARYDYTPFGQTSNPPGTVEEAMQFTGKERDVQTELDYFSARDFMSLTGRFTTPDDPAYMDPFNPQSMNRFAYAYNNPFRYNDPTGHSGDCIGGYDPTTGNCEAIDFIGFPGFPGFLWNMWGSLGTAVELVQPVTNFVTAARDPACVAGSVGIGASVGGVAGGILGGAGGGAGGALGGSLVAPGVGTIGGAFAGGTAGFAKGSAVGVLAGGVFGGAFGTVACMGTGGSGGGGGGRASSGQGSFWKQLKPFRGKTKTNGQSGSARRFYERDYTHGDIEVYDSQGRHLGSANPETGAITKPPVPGRRIGL